MNDTHDPELELFQRTIDLVEFALRCGYLPLPEDSAPGLAVLEHLDRDRIVVGQSLAGTWIYASVPEYTPRRPGEPAEQALARLGQAIRASPDRGTIVEFVKERQRGAAVGETLLGAVRKELQDFLASELPLDLEDPLRLPTRGERVERARGPSREPALAEPPRWVQNAPLGTGGAGARDRKPERNRRRDDWTPDPEGGGAPRRPGRGR